MIKISNMQHLVKNRMNIKEQRKVFKVPKDEKKYLKTTNIK
jgi:hypothetical protein